MAVLSASAAKHLCDLSGWRLTNLQLQKILHIAHMLHMGKSGGEPLVNEKFEAWDYGPVLPSVYSQVRMFGSDPVRDVFYHAPPIEAGSEATALRDTWNAVGAKPARDLVAITHWEQGAWAKSYLKGIKGIGIPNSDVLAEYRARMKSTKS